ncbi:MAG: methyltransferase domain-containing protein [Candidatus Coatesbacteria bacterium]|nr:MAG: methyltransferase domain-containing protein [Candidatus Coatesbacteria bacterium]
MRPLLVCPGCRGPLADVTGGLRCEPCGAVYPVVSGVPHFAGGGVESGPGFKERLAARAPSIYRAARLGARVLFPVWNTRSVKNLRRLEGEVFAENRSPVVLNAGSGDASGPGMSALSGRFRARMINLDTAVLPAVNLRADVGGIPLADGCVDLVLAKALLEHVPGPDAVIGEFARVLRPGGRVYVEMPWLEGYHGYPGDYRRWTAEETSRVFAGHGFAEAETGIVAGPASAAGLFFREFLGSFFDNPALKFLSKDVIGSVLVFLWRFLDIYLARKKSARVLAAVVYYIGVKGK